MLLSMRAFLLFLALAVPAAWLEAQESPVDPEGGRADLEELLRLPARYWGEGTTAFIHQTFERFELTPELGGVVSGSGLGLGVRQQWFQNERSVLGWSALATYKGYQDVSLFYVRELDRAGRIDWKTDLRYRDLTDERFLGLGMESDPANRSDFRLTETLLRTQLGVELSGTSRLYLGSDVRRLKAHFDGEGAFTGRDFVADARSFDYGSLAVGLAWDTRDAPGYARKGSFVGGEVRQFLGLDSETPSYRKLSLELQNTIPLPGRDHVLATRLRVDSLLHDSETSLPFFLTQGLGGSHSLRSFSLNRFRGYDRLLATVEYRFGVLPGKLDGVAFWDTGGVYDHLGAASVESLQHSLGAGVRLLRGRRVLLRLEIAHGIEGTRFLASFSTPF